MLIPKASLSYDQDKWSINNSHGIDSLIDNSNREFEMIFTNQLDDPDNYYVHCSVMGSNYDINSDGIRITLPENFDVSTGKPIKVYAQRMTF